MAGLQEAWSDRARRSPSDPLGCVGIEFQRVARLLGGLGSGIHGNAHIGLRQSGCIVGAVTGHGHRVAGGLLLADEGEFVLGPGFSQEIIHTGLIRLTPVLFKDS